MFQTTNQVKSSVSPLWWQLHRFRGSPTGPIPGQMHLWLVLSHVLQGAKPGWGLALFKMGGELCVFFFFRVSFFFFFRNILVAFKTSIYFSVCLSWCVYLPISATMRYRLWFQAITVCIYLYIYIYTIIYIEKSQHMCIPAPLGGRLKCLPDLA